MDLEKTLEFVGLREAARHIGRSESWMRRNMRDLGIPYYKVGGRYEFILIELDEWFVSCHQIGKAAKRQKEWAKLAS
jgi:hypothetical protein